jgi:hypothetical protein
MPIRSMVLSDSVDVPRDLLKIALSAILIDLSRTAVVGTGSHSSHTWTTPALECISRGAFHVLIILLDPERDDAYPRSSTDSPPTD